MESKMDQLLEENASASVRSNEPEDVDRSIHVENGNEEFQHDEDPSVRIESCSPEDTIIVYFDLETSGFGPNSDILQIAMKSSGEIGFDKYLSPHHSIHPRASEVNGLTSDNRGRLYLHGKPVPTVSTTIALEQLLKYLKNFGKPVTLVAHNCAFDARFLTRLIVAENFVPDFKNVIGGFTDTLQLFKKKFPERKSKGMWKLGTLVRDLLNRSPEGAHNAYQDVCFLEELTEHHFTVKEVIDQRKTFDKILQMAIKSLTCDEFLPSLMQPLRGLVSEQMLKRIASAGISFDMILETYRIEGREKVQELLKQKDNDGKPQLIKTKKILKKILDYISILINSNL